MAGSWTSRSAGWLILPSVRNVQMHTKLTPDNPHGYNRYGFAWQNVPSKSTAHLDFGCYNGSFLATLKSKEITRLVGVDINQDAVCEARERFQDISTIHIYKTVPLPFDDGEFTSITVLDVLEHVNGQKELLDELHRVLRKDGTLVVTVPGQHIFSFLDVGNLKFRFPRIHRWYYCARHSEAEYEYRYTSNPDGLIGDVSAKKRWHEHFSRRKLRKLLERAGFYVIEFDGAGFFSRLIKPVLILTEKCKWLRLLFDKLNRVDARLFESTNLFCAARKTDG